MAGEHELVLGTGISLLDLFGISPTVAKIVVAFLVISFATYLFIRFRYPCRSPSSLMQVVKQAKKIFNECHSLGAFKLPLTDQVQIARITSRASEISARARPTDHQSDNEHGTLKILRDYLQRVYFLWGQLKDVVKCHREAQLLIRDLKTCMMQASHSHVNFRLQNRRAVAAPAIYNVVDGLV
ncbi:hypothetical protein L218DRAFT_1006831 [Marasmius fiardii PR-910]|nr:hypothetical protein L218DRAFT_1006831 [Marasmius fiardii PR-910]